MHFMLPPSVNKLTESVKATALAEGPLADMWSYLCAVRPTSVRGSGPRLDQGRWLFTASTEPLWRLSAFKHLTKKRKDRRDTRSHKDWIRF